MDADFSCVKKALRNCVGLANAILFKNDFSLLKERTSGLLENLFADPEFLVDFFGR